MTVVLCDVMSWSLLGWYQEPAPFILKVELDEEDASSALSMKAGGFSKRLLPTYQTTPCYIPEAPSLNPYPMAFPYGNGMVLHFYQQQESSTTKTVHKVINKRLKAYV